MDEEHSDHVQSAAERVIELEEELETTGHASIDAASLANAHAILHKWIDSVTGVVSNPGLGRVTLIHRNGRYSTISSPDLPFAMSLPEDKRPEAFRTAR